MLPNRNRFFSIISILLSILLMSCAPMPINSSASNESNLSDIQLTAQELQVAQRLMISIRYFCQQQMEGKNCLQPVTKLPPELSRLIEQTSVAGVVLFAENIESHHQVIQLTNDLQQAAVKSNSQQGMFIGIDQEGGRVVRLDRSDSTAFSGNMAIGATYPTKGTYYASEVGKIIGKELNALGINLNFSPDVDVNNNPDNPVINVRSFGEQPKLVAELGLAMMDAFQEQQVIATLKHFPGHGNTSVDSHTGLPSVNYDRSTVYETDLLPYKYAIENSNPGMIMTAHIQFPSLDSSKIKNKDGDSIIVPATLSKKILTGILKNEFQFKGVIITDALNMAGISHQFDLEQATAQSLMAGADIALMPYKIRYPSDVLKFKQFVRKVTQLMSQAKDFRKNMQSSLSRIEHLKSKFNLSNQSQLLANDKPIDQRITAAQYVLASESHRARQKQLAYDSVSLLKGDAKVFPLTEKVGRKLQVIVQDSEQKAVVEKAIEHYWPRANQSQVDVKFTLLSDYHHERFDTALSKADVLLLFYSETRESAVVKGELEDINLSPTAQKELHQQRQQAIDNILAMAGQLRLPILVAGMQSPYEMRRFIPLSNSVLTAYDASIYKDKGSGEIKGVTYQAMVASLLGVNPVRGVLPVRLDSQQAVCDVDLSSCSKPFAE